MLIAKSSSSLDPRPPSDIDPPPAGSCGSRPSAAGPVTTSGLFVYPHSVRFHRVASEQTRRLSGLGKFVGKIVLLDICCSHGYDIRILQHRRLRRAGKKLGTKFERIRSVSHLHLPSSAHFFLHTVLTACLELGLEVSRQAPGGQSVASIISDQLPFLYCTVAQSHSCTLSARTRMQSTR